MLATFKNEASEAEATTEHLVGETGAAGREGRAGAEPGVQCLENVENQLQMVCTMAALAASAPADDDATGSVDSSAARCFDRRWKQYRPCSSRIRRQCAGTRRSGY
jgi:hypothetical protein